VNRQNSRQVQSLLFFVYRRHSGSFEALASDGAGEGVGLPGGEFILGASKAVRRGFLVGFSLSLILSHVL